MLNFSYADVSGSFPTGVKGTWILLSINYLYRNSYYVFGKLFSSLERNKLNTQTFGPGGPWANPAGGKLSLLWPEKFQHGHMLSCLKVHWVNYMTWVKTEMLVVSLCNTHCFQCTMLWLPVTAREGAAVHFTLEKMALVIVTPLWNSHTSQIDIILFSC